MQRPRAQNQFGWGKIVQQRQFAITVPAAAAAARGSKASRVSRVRPAGVTCRCSSGITANMARTLVAILPSCLQIFRPGKNRVGHFRTANVIGPKRPSPSRPLRFLISREGRKTFFGRRQNTAASYPFRPCPDGATNTGRAARWLKPPRPKKPLRRAALTGAGLFGPGPARVLPVLACPVSGQKSSEVLGFS